MCACCEDRKILSLVEGEELQARMIRPLLGKEMSCRYRGTETDSRVLGADGYSCVITSSCFSERSVKEQASVLQQRPQDRRRVHLIEAKRMHGGGVVKRGFSARGRK
jgi:hypothetical protein